MEYNKICVLDTETTDRYWNTAAPVQIAAIICDNKGIFQIVLKKKLRQLIKSLLRRVKYTAFMQKIQNTVGEKLRCLLISAYG